MTASPIHSRRVAFCAVVPWFTRGAAAVNSSPSSTAPRTPHIHGALRNGPSRLHRALLRPLIVPAHHVELCAHPVRRFRSGAVKLALEAQQRRRHSAHLERRVIL